MRPRLLAPSICSAALAAFCLPTGSFAQASDTLLAQPLARIAGPVSNSALVTLKGNTNPLAQSRYDTGVVSPSLPTGRMQLIFRRSAAQQIALQQYLGSLQDPHSANYHKWLTPRSYGASFGIAAQDLEAVEQWLTSEGFKIESVPASRNLIEFSGTTGAVAQAFHTSMHTYTINGVQHHSNANDPQIPAALAPVVAGISRLNDFRAKPMHVRGRQVEAVEQNGRLQVTSAARTSAARTSADRTSAAGALTPLDTTSISNAPFLLVTPADAATIYNAPNSLNKNYSGTTQRTGSGVNIGLAEYSDLQVADYANYRRLFLKEANPPAPNLVVDGVDPGIENGGGDGDEVLLDAEVAAAIAPNANIYVYSSSSDLVDDGLTDAAIRAIEDNVVSVLSLSYGTCEAELGASGNSEYAELWQEAAAQGITVVVAAGDSGSAGCDAGSNGPAVNGLTVNGLGSTPYNVSVGGTDFDTLSTNFSQYVNATNSTSATTPYASALSYIPENPWNDSISNNPPGAYTTNTAQKYTDPSSTTPFTILDAGSGGVSSAAYCAYTLDSSGNCPGLLTGYSTPPFQSGINVGTAATAGFRYLPDVSLFAAPGNEHPVGWAFCSDSVLDGATTTYTDCAPATAGGTFSVQPIGGTSASTPAFAGVLAQVIQSLGNNPRLGVANNVLYNLFATNSNSGTIFHDVTVGNNSVPCATGSPSCGSNGFLNGYNATTGYDLATGLGSVDIAALISAWPSVAFTPTSTTLQLNNSTGAVSITHGTAVTVTSTVSPTSATGVVSINGPANQAGLSASFDLPLANGTTGSQSVNYLPGGSYTLQAYYPGDVSHSPSSSATPIQVNVSPENSLPFVFIQFVDLATGQAPASSTTVPYGEYGFAYVQPANTNAVTAGTDGSATGSVNLLNSGTLVGSQTLNSVGVAAFPVYDNPPGSYSYTATYSGDASFNPSTNNSVTALVITKATPALVIHTGSTAATSATTHTLTVELDTDSAGAYPTGNISLSVNGTPYTGTIAKAVLGDGAAEELVTITVPSSALSGTSPRLQATYAGDTNYSGITSATCTYVAAAATAELTRQPLPNRHLLLAFGSTTLLSSVLFFGIPARRRAWRTLLLALFAVSLMGEMGCGSSTSGTSPTNPLSSVCAQ